MAIEYQFAEDGFETLCVAAWGRDDSMQEVVGYGRAVIGEAIARGCRRVLCDERGLEYAIGTIDIFEAAQTIADHAPKVARVAIVCAPACAEDADFWETVAVNRSLCVRVFLDPAEARSWLMEA
jgi:hypothetical protein